MLVSRRAKRRRELRGKMRGEVKDGKTITFDEYSLETVEFHRITNKQIKAIRIAMARFMKRGGRVWVRVFPQKSCAVRGVGVRMGSNKGAPAGWVAVARRGKVMFKTGGVSEDVVREVLRLALNKFPTKTKLAKKSSEVGGGSSEG